MAKQFACIDGRKCVKFILIRSGAIFSQDFMDVCSRFVMCLSLPHLPSFTHRYDVESQCDNILQVLEGFLSGQGLSAVARSNAECAAFAVATFSEAAKHR